MSELLRRRSWRQRASDSFTGAGSWLGLAVLGFVVQWIADRPDVPKDARDLLGIAGGLAALVGSAGLGVVLGRYRADEVTKARLSPAFWRSVNLYQGLARIQGSVREATSNTELRQTSISVKDALANLRQVNIRVEEQILGLDAALDEWDHLVPDEVARYKTGLRNKAVRDD